MKRELVREIDEMREEEQLTKIAVLTDKDRRAEMVQEQLVNDWGLMVEGKGFDKLTKDPQAAFIRHTPEYLNGILQMFSGTMIPSLGQKMLKHLQNEEYSELRTLTDVYSKIVSSMKNAKVPMVNINMFQNPETSTNASSSLDALIVD